MGTCKEYVNHYAYELQIIKVDELGNFQDTVSSKKSVSKCKSISHEKSYEAGMNDSFGQCFKIKFNNLEMSTCYLVLLFIGCTKIA